MILEILRIILVIWKSKKYRILSEGLTRIPNEGESKVKFLVILNWFQDLMILIINVLRF